MNRESIELEVLEQFFTKAVNELIERTADYDELEEDLRETYKEIDELEEIKHHLELDLNAAKKLIRELTNE